MTRPGACRGPVPLCEHTGCSVSTPSQDENQQLVLSRKLSYFNPPTTALEFAAVILGDFGPLIKRVEFLALIDRPFKLWHGDRASRARLSARTKSWTQVHTSSNTKKKDQQVQASGFYPAVHTLLYFHTTCRSRTVASSHTPAIHSSCMRSAKGGRIK